MIPQPAQYGYATLPATETEAVRSEQENSDTSVIKDFAALASVFVTGYAFLLIF